MQSVYNSFIGMYNNVYEDGFCSHMISEFERFSAGGYCGNRQYSEGVAKTKKHDEFLFLNLKNHYPTEFNNKPSTRIFFDGLQRC